jgi:hypothetical protein
MESHRDSGMPLCHHWPISIEVSNLASPKLCHRTKKTECCYANCMHLRNVLGLSEMSSIAWCFSSVLSSFVQNFKSTHTSHNWTTMAKCSTSLLRLWITTKWKWRYTSRILYCTSGCPSCRDAVGLRQAKCAITDHEYMKLWHPKLYFTVMKQWGL